MSCCKEETLATCFAKKSLLVSMIIWNTLLFTIFNLLIYSIIALHSSMWFIIIIILTVIKNCIYSQQVIYSINFNVLFCVSIFCFWFWNRSYRRMYLAATENMTLHFFVPIWWKCSKRLFAHLNFLWKRAPQRVRQCVGSTLHCSCSIIMMMTGKYNSFKVQKNWQ